MIEWKKWSRNILGSWLCIGLAFSSFASAQNGAANEFDLPLTGVTFIGASNGRAVAGTLSLLGCSWFDLGPSPLTSSIDIHGTAANDTIRVVDTPNVIFCNQVLQPIAQNGNAIQLYGGDGDDILFGGGYSPFPGNPNWIFGEGGNDTLYLGAGGARGEGGPGDDRIYGTDSSGDQLIGGAGNDVLCEHANAPPLAIDGGDGLDTSCSASAGAGGFTNIELVSCLPCGFGY